MSKNLLVPLMIGIIAIAIFLIVSTTISTVLAFIPGVILSYIIYLGTFYKRTPSPDRILPLYLLSLGIQFLHFMEEYLTDFNEVVPGLFAQEAYSKDYWLIFNMVAYFIFIIGGIILFKQMKELMIIPLFFILVGVLLNSLAHILISVYVGGYFSGLYSALIYAVIGPILIKRIFDETRIVDVN